VGSKIEIKSNILRNYLSDTMNYDRFKKEMDKEICGDSIFTGAGLTGEFILYGFLVVCLFLLSRVFGKVLLAMVGILAVGMGLQAIPMVFKFRKENSNNIALQLFWISMLLGAISMIIFITGSW